MTDRHVAEIFKPGLKGMVIIRNQFGAPVYVAGMLGSGRVVFSGCYLSGQAAEGVETPVFQDVLEWLAICEARNSL